MNLQCNFETGRSEKGCLDCFSQNYRIFKCFLEYLSESTSKSYFISVRIAVILISTLKSFLEMFVKLQKFLDLNDGLQVQKAFNELNKPTKSYFLCVLLFVTLIFWESVSMQLAEK